MVLAKSVREACLRQARGQSTVELALLLPLMLLFCIGIVDFGRVYQYDIVAVSAARVGARAAADTRNSDAIAIAAAQADASPTVVTVSVSPAGSRTAGTDVEVTVTYVFTPLFSSMFFADYIPNPFRTITITRQATMVAF